MSTFTEDDLRRALSTDADADAPPLDVWSRLQRRRARQQRVRAGVILAGAAAVTAAVVFARTGHDDATVLPPATSSAPTLVPDRPLSAAEMRKAVDSFRERLDSLGVDHTTINAGDGSVEIDAPGTTRADIAAIAVQGELQIRPVKRETQGADGTIDYRLGLIALDNSSVDRAAAVQDPQSGDWLVQLTFDREGARKFHTLTADAASKPDIGSCGPPDGCNAIAFVVDGTVISAPTVLQPGGISGGQAQITGAMTKEDAQTLAALATSDPLPTAFHLSP
jgi:preprotein translocase subunit SecD